MISFKYVIDNEVAMMSLGAELAKAIETTNSCVLIYLSGDLGAGKTTLVRGFLRYLGYIERVKSPTYTIVECYSLPRMIYHFDLYRIADPKELDFIGINDYWQEGAVWLVEWPEHGAALLPEPAIEVQITLARFTATEQQRRQVEIKSQSLSGHEIMEYFSYARTLR